MKRSIVSFLLSLSSFSGVILCFVLASQNIPFISLPNGFGVGDRDDFAFIIRNIGAIVILITLASMSIRFAKNSYSNNGGFTIAEIKPIESVAVPTYIGLFVIAIELSGVYIDGNIGIFSRVDIIHSLFLLLMFAFWVRFEKIFYFNPIWLLYGYRFYETKATDGNTYTLITKRKDAKGKLRLESLMRINNYTFMEV